MREVRRRLDNLATELSASLHAVQSTVTARQGRERPPRLPPRLWTVSRPTVLALLLYAAGFLLAESMTWLLAFAVSPTLEGSSPLFLQGAVVVFALLLASPRRWWIYLILTALL